MLGPIARVEGILAMPILEGLEGSWTAGRGQDTRRAGIDDVIRKLESVDTPIGDINKLLNIYTKTNFRHNK